MTLTQEFKEYRNTLNKLGLHGATLDLLADDYKITMTENYYELGERKAFPRKPQRSETRQISARNYACYVTSIGFFRDRVIKGYTGAGYIPIKLTCTNPDRTLKIERIFQIEYIGRY